MKHNGILKASVIVMVALVSFSACKKDKTTSSAATSTDDNGASDAARLEQTNNDVISIADVAGATGSANLRTTATTSLGCATVTNDTVSVPHMLTINFGPSDCVCLDGRARRGSIVVTYSGHYKDSGSVHTIGYDNYFVNDLQVKGSKTVTNLGMDLSGNVAYNITVNDSIVLNTDSTISWTGTRTRTWQAGYATPSRMDDVYTITGTTVLTRANGHVFTFDITAPLTVATSCAYIEAGQMTITGTTISNSRIIDYGTTAVCDDQATINIDGYIYNITLH